MIPLTYGLYLAAFVFAMGLLIIIIKKNAIFVLIGIELILNAANLNLILFAANDPSINGQVFGVFVVVLAAAEAAVALAILLHVFRYYKSSNLDQLNRLRY
ncbi:MAG: NADH-quinone oxidoreductase subunit NuoK [Cyclobacteriaceae bacterium]